MTSETRLWIDQRCSVSGTLKCCQCWRELSTHRGLIVHTPQHFANVFLSMRGVLLSTELLAAPPAHSLWPHGQEVCGSPGQILGIPRSNAATPGDPHNQAALALEFLAGQPTVEETNEEEEVPATATRPAATQPLRVVMFLVGRSLVLEQTATTKRRNLRSNKKPWAANVASLPVKCLHKDKLRQLRRRRKIYLTSRNLSVAWSAGEKCDDTKHSHIYL